MWLWSWDWKKCHSWSWTKTEWLGKNPQGRGLAWKWPHVFESSRSYFDSISSRPRKKMTQFFHFKTHQDGQLYCGWCQHPRARSCHYVAVYRHHVDSSCHSICSICSICSCHSLVGWLNVASAVARLGWLARRWGAGGGNASSPSSKAALGERRGGPPNREIVENYETTKTYPEDQEMQICGNLDWHRKWGCTCWWFRRSMPFFGEVLLDYFGLSSSILNWQCAF